jgi:hypothetical protein
MKEPLAGIGKNSAKDRDQPEERPILIADGTGVNGHADLGISQ